MHWYNFQINILVHITYKLNLEFGATSPESPHILKEVDYYISDDKSHDCLFVQHVLTKHWEYLKSKGWFPKVHAVWNDNCTTQSKVHELGTLLLVIHKLQVVRRGQKEYKWFKIILQVVMLQGRGWWCRCLIETWDSERTN
jgi:hypothetical protein